MTWKKKIELIKKIGIIKTGKAIAAEKRNHHVFLAYKHLLDGLIYDYTKMLVDCRVELKPGIHKCLEHLLVIKREHFQEDKS